jgi:hypothetical protein
LQGWAALVQVLLGELTANEQGPLACPKPTQAPPLREGRPPTSATIAPDEVSNQLVGGVSIA